MEIQAERSLGLSTLRSLAATLTLDGATGSGKSTLARELAARYGCGALEIGMIVRTVAWLAYQGRMQTSGAVARLASLSAAGEFDLVPSDDAAACDVRIEGRLRMGELLDSRLAPVVTSVSLDNDAMAWVHSLARELSRGRRVVITGREAGSEIFQDAGLKVRLEADWGTRRARKASQVGSAPAVDDVRLLPPAGSGALIIDTTRISPKQALAEVASVVEERLGWTPVEFCPPVLELNTQAEPEECLADLGHSLSARVRPIPSTSPLTRGTSAR